MNRLFIVVLVFVSLLSLGCMSDTGRVYLDTVPHDATVFVNDVEIGKTPVEFNFTHDEPMELEIVKTGYYPVSERMDTYWLRMEVTKGNYGEYRDEKPDGTKSRLYWKVMTTRKLHEK